MLPTIPERKERKECDIANPLPVCFRRTGFGCWDGEPQCRSGDICREPKFINTDGEVVRARNEDVTYRLGAWCVRAEESGEGGEGGLSPSFMENRVITLQVRGRGDSGGGRIGGDRAVERITRRL